MVCRKFILLVVRCLWKWFLRGHEVIGREKLEDSLFEFCVRGRRNLMIEVMIEVDIRDLIPENSNSEQIPDLVGVRQRMKDLYDEISLIVSEQSILVPIGDAFATSVNPLQLREIIRLPNVLAVRCSRRK